MTSQLEKIATQPATTVVTNIPAPTFAPTPISVIPDITEIISENTSGAPLPKARNVTPRYQRDQEIIPATLGGIRNFSTTESITTQK